MIMGVRTIELRAALWAKTDLDNVIWEIPWERMKMRRVHLVPLSTKALDLLNELKIMTGNYRNVFPGRNDPNKPMSEVSINQVIKCVGYGGRVTGRGFTHSLSTILHEMDLILHGLKCNSLMLIKIVFEELIIMPYTLRKGRK